MKTEARLLHRCADKSALLHTLATLWSLEAALLLHLKAPLQNKQLHHVTDITLFCVKQRSSKIALKNEHNTFLL